MNSTTFGIDNTTLLLLALGLLLLLWWLGRSPRIAHGSKVQMDVFCLRCNWHGRVSMGETRCGKCRAQHLSVLNV